MLLSWIEVFLLQCSNAFFFLQTWPTFFSSCQKVQCLSHLFTEQKIRYTAIFLQVVKILVCSGCFFTSFRIAGLLSSITHPSKKCLENRYTYFLFSLRFECVCLIKIRQCHCLLVSWVGVWVSF